MRQPLASAARERVRPSGSITGQSKTCSASGAGDARATATARLAPAEVAGDSEATRIDAEALGIGGDRLHDGDAVLDRSGKAVLGREAIIHRDDAAVAARRQRRAQRIVRIQGAGDPASAMKIDERRKLGVGPPRRAIMTQRQRRRVAGQESRRAVRLRARAPRRPPSRRSPAAGRSVGGPDPSARARGDEIEEAPCVRIEARFRPLGGRRRRAHAPRNRATNASIAPIERKFSGVRSSSGIAMS